jgi:hypothetical protein
LWNNGAEKSAPFFFCYLQKFREHGNFVVPAAEQAKKGLKFPGAVAM